MRRFQRVLFPANKSKKKKNGSGHFISKILPDDIGLTLMFKWLNYEWKWIVYPQTTLIHLSQWRKFGNFKNCFWTNLFLSRNDLPVQTVKLRHWPWTRTPSQIIAKSTCNKQQRAIPKHEDEWWWSWDTGDWLMASHWAPLCITM